MPLECCFGWFLGGLSIYIYIYDMYLCDEAYTPNTQWWYVERFELISDKVHISISMMTCEQIDNFSLEAAKSLALPRTLPGAFFQRCQIVWKIAQGWQRWKNSGIEASQHLQMFRIQNALAIAEIAPCGTWCPWPHSWFRGKPITGSVPYVEMNSKGAWEWDDLVVVRIVAVILCSLLFRFDMQWFLLATGEPICLLCKVQGHSLNFETSCQECFEGLHRKTISDACHPEDSNTLQVLGILKMSLFGLQSKTVLSSKITCHVLCHCSPCSRCTIVPRAVSPGTWPGSAVIAAWRKRLETIDTLPIILVVQWTISPSKTNFIHSGLQ